MEENTKYRKLVTWADTRHVDWNFANNFKTRIKTRGNTRPELRENLSTFESALKNKIVNL